MKAHQKRLLDQGKIEKPVGVLRALPSRPPAIAEKIRTEADYFERNAERMRCWCTSRGCSSMCGKGARETWIAGNHRLKLSGDLRGGH